MGNKTKKSSNESPTDQEHRAGDRDYQAYRVQLTVGSIFFGYLIFGRAHCLKSSFLYVFPPQRIIPKYCILVTAVCLCCRQNICLNDVVSSVQVVPSFYISLIEMMICFLSRIFVVEVQQETAH